MLPGSIQGASLFCSKFCLYSVSIYRTLGGVDVMRARTIREAASYFRETDPQTCLTETAIRRLICSGAVPSVRVGRKYLVTVEALEAYLSGNIQLPAKAQPAKVWKIE